MLAHRWMGVGFCVLFFAWFTSGMVMMYWRFPTVDAEDRIARAAALDPATIHVNAQRAAKSVPSGAPSRVRLNVLDGRPVYRFSSGRKSTLVFADDGRRIDAIPQEMALRIASAWIGLPANSASFEGLIVYDDQWTVEPSISSQGPFWKYSWPNFDEIYVSHATGEVVQHTNRASRIGAYFGAIPHWLYFTGLLRDRRIWSQAVIWISGAGTVMSLLGLAAGVWLYSSSKRVPFKGQKHWHVILGLVFGLVTCTWVFSGLLSMSPFDWLNDRDVPDLQRAFHGDRLDLGLFLAKKPSEAIVVSHLEAKELEFVVLAGTPLYLASETVRKTRLIPMNGPATNSLETSQIMEAIKRAAAIAESRLVTEYENYYVDRQNKHPLPVLYVRLDDAQRSAFYIDLKSGKVVESYGSRSRLERWLYHGLHSIDLPWLYARRPGWDILVLFLLLGGASLSVTSLIIAWKLIRRKFSSKCRRVSEEALAQ